MATEYVPGSTMIAQWIYSGGTINFAPDLRSSSFSPSAEFIDATAGADTVRKRLVSFKDASASLAWVDQTNSAGTASALDAGTGGTLILGPEGSATGKRKITMPAFSQGAKYTFPFDNVAEATCDFLSNGAYTDSTY